MVTLKLKQADSKFNRSKSKPKSRVVKMLDTADAFPGDENNNTRNEHQMFS
jgi:hypothetical protein